MSDLRNNLERLVAEHGVDELQKVAASLKNSMDLQVPAHHLGVLNPKALQHTVNQLNGAFDDILSSGQDREDAYQEIGDLRKQSRLLDTEIELAEAEALMNIRYLGKDAYGIMPQPLAIQDEGPIEVLLSNDKARKAYMVTYSAEFRKRKAEVDGKILKLEAKIGKATATWETNNSAAGAAMRKADIQAALLHYLRR